MHVTGRRAAVTIALVVISLTAGCIGGLSADGSVDPTVVGDAVEQRYAALNGYDATVTYTVDVDGSTSEARADVSVRGEQRDVTYTAGSRAGQATTGTTDEGLVFDAGTSATTPATAAGYGALAEALVRTNDVHVERVTTVDHRRTAVVKLTPAENESDAANVTRTVWVDLERSVPSRVVTAWETADGQTATVTVEYDDVTLYENRSGSHGVSV